MKTKTHFDLISCCEKIPISKLSTTMLPPPPFEDIFSGCHDIQHNDTQHKEVVYDTQHNNALYCAGSRVLFTVMLSVIMVNVVKLSVAMLNVAMLNVAMLNVVILSVVVPFSDMIIIGTNYGLFDERETHQLIFNILY